jgi:hypothetical protein
LTSGAECISFVHVLPSLTYASPFIHFQVCFGRENNHTTRTSSYQWRQTRAYARTLPPVVKFYGFIHNIKQLISILHRTLNPGRWRQFETSGTDYPVTQCNIPQQRNPQSHRCDNLRTRKIKWHSKQDTDSLHNCDSVVTNQKVMFHTNTRTTICKVLPSKR